MSDIMTPRTPVRHKECGEVIGFYLRAEPRKPDMVLSIDFERLDGSHPIEGEVFRERCPRCEIPIVCSYDMKRCFDETTFQSREQI